MSSFEEHEAEQAALSARYEALSPIQQAVHDILYFHLDDVPSDEHQCYELLVDSDEPGSLEFADEWKQDRNETYEEIEPILAQISNLDARLNESPDGDTYNEVMRLLRPFLPEPDPEPVEYQVFQLRIDMNTELLKATPMAELSLILLILSKQAERGELEPWMEVVDGNNDVCGELSIRTEED